MSLPDAKSFGPGLLTQVMFAKQLKSKKVLGCRCESPGRFDPRDVSGCWLGRINSENRLFARQFNSGESSNLMKNTAPTLLNFPVYCSTISCELHQTAGSLPFDHGISSAPAQHRLFRIAEGLAINTRRYLILNSEIFGVGARDLNLISLVVSLPSRGNPQFKRHEGYPQLDRNDRVAVAKMASILRIAKALDVSQNQRINKISCDWNSEFVNFRTEDVVDLGLERLELEQVGSMFTDIFGTEVTLQAGGDEL